MQITIHYIQPSKTTQPRATLNYQHFTIPPSSKLQGLPDIGIMRIHCHSIVIGNFWMQCLIGIQACWSCRKPWLNIVQAGSRSQDVIFDGTPFRYSSWWFQPIWKILVKSDNFPQVGLQIQKCLKTPSSYIINWCSIWQELGHLGWLVILVLDEPSVAGRFKSSNSSPQKGYRSHPELS